MSYSIGERLKAYTQKYGVEIPEIAKATGIAKHKLYKWQSGTKPRKQKEVIILEHYLDEMEKKKLTMDEGNTGFQTKGATLCLPLDPTKKALSQVDGKAAGTIVIENNSSELIVDRIEAPFIGNVDGAVEITSENMEPTIKKGTRVAIIRLEDIRLLDWGECYFIIDKNGQGSVRRVQEGEEKSNIILESDNPNYPPIKRYWNEIEAILKVKAGILKY
jgi:phage repressor protein C with HTH and peptisase S24 domain